MSNYEYRVTNIKKLDEPVTVYRGDEPIKKARYEAMVFCNADGDMGYRDHGIPMYFWTLAEATMYKKHMETPKKELGVIEAVVDAWINSRYDPNKMTLVDVMLNKETGEIFHTWRFTKARDDVFHDCNALIFARGKTKTSCDRERDIFLDQLAKDPNALYNMIGAKFEGTTDMEDPWIRIMEDGIQNLHGVDGYPCVPEDYREYFCAEDYAPDTVDDATGSPEMWAAFEDFLLKFYDKPIQKIVDAIVEYVHMYADDELFQKFVKKNDIDLSRVHTR